jgi:transcription elongation factor Elf1
MITKRVSYTGYFKGCPDVMEDSKLIACPHCGAKFPQQKRPSLLTYTNREHDVWCSNCGLRTPKAYTTEQAINWWNDGVYKNGAS